MHKAGGAVVIGRAGDQPARTRAPDAPWPPCATAARHSHSLAAVPPHGQPRPVVAAQPAGRPASHARYGAACFWSGRRKERDICLGGTGGRRAAVRPPIDDSARRRRFGSVCACKQAEQSERCCCCCMQHRERAEGRMGERSSGTPPARESGRRETHPHTPTHTRAVMCETQRIAADDSMVGRRTHCTALRCGPGQDRQH